MNIVRSFGPFGLLFPSLAATAFLVRGSGRLVFTSAPLRQQVLGGATLVLAAFIGGMQLFLHLGLVRPLVLFGALLACVVALWWLLRRAGIALEWHRCVPRVQGGWAHWPLGVVVALGIGVLCLAAYWLPVWQWDALGYHLPFVNFVLQGGGLSELPPDVPYLSTYPRNVGLLFTALRAVLPDDRLVDLGQLPLGLIGAAATGGIARELGARPMLAWGAGASWLLLPAVFLQLPTNYIDVGVATFFLLVAFFLLVPVTSMSLLCAGLALGLFLGTKPSVPPAALLLGGVVIARGFRANHRVAACGALVLAALLGFEAYAIQWARHHNPVWPAVVDLGPLHLDGTITVRELLSSGAGAEKVHGPLAARILRSWFSFSSTPIFDMRVGGLGPCFWLGLPLSAWFVWRGRHVLLGVLVALAVVTPDPAVARYVLAFPALVLASSAACVSKLGDKATVAAQLVLALLAANNLRYAFPGLTGEGPPLFAYASMSWQEREVAVGANGRPTEIADARRRLHAADVVVYDKAAWLPYLFWRSDLANRVVRLPDDASREVAERVALGSHTRLVVAGAGLPLSRVAAERTERLVHRFDCREPCRVYEVHE